MKFIAHRSSFIVAFLFLCSPAFSQEIRVSVPVHPVYVYSQTGPLMTFQQDAAPATTGNEVEWRDKTGALKCWADANGQLNCVGGLGGNVTIEHNGTFVGTRPIVNVIDSSSVTITAADNPGNTRVDLTWAACTSVQVSEREAGCEHEINFIPGTNISSITAVDNPGNGSNDVTINASGAPGPPGPAACATVGIVTDLYVDSRGSDITGDGTIAKPWQTLQHAVDVGVPAVVCGPYYVNIITAGSYAGFTLNNRIYLGGGPTCADGPITYAGVEIVGETANTDTFIINTPIVVDGGVLSLRGVSSQTGAIGITAKNHSFLNLAAVSSRNNHLGVLGAMMSTIHIEPGAYVNDDYTHSFLATVQAFSASSDGIEVTEDSVLTDSCPDGNNTDLGVVIECDSLSTGTFGIACIEAKKGQTYIRGTVVADGTVGNGFSQGGLVARDSEFSIYYYTYKGATQGASGTGAVLYNSTLSGEAFGGAIYNIGHAVNGIKFNSGSTVAPPGITNTTNNYVDVSPGSTFKGSSTSSMTGDVTEVVVFSATPTFNLFYGARKKITLTGDVTSSAVTNPVNGSVIEFQICQDGGGSHAFVWPANFKGADAIGATLSTCSVQRFVYDLGLTTWYATAPIQKNM